tara:strand:+ start:3798 stop:4685 length:888 start_codon:yes stop_codon:yes gene_type:complete
MKPPSILLLGSIALDTIETLYGKRENLLGGSATYAAISASQAVNPDLVGIVGSDFPIEGHKILEKACHSLSDLVIKDGSTFRWGGKYHENGDDRETLFTDLGVFTGFEPTLSSENRNPDIVFLANIHPQIQLSTLDQCENKPTVVTDTMNLWIDTAKDELSKVLFKTDILLINESELMDITSNDDIEQGIREIHSSGPSTVIVKYGSKGSTCYSGGQSFSIGVIPIDKVLDPTGAGDSFGGGLVSALAEGLTLKEAMIRGTVLASFCIEDFGIDGILKAKKEEIETRISFLSSKD